MSYTEPETPENIPEIFVEAWNNRDARKLASLFAEDAEFVNVTGLWWHNRSDIYDVHEYGLRVIFNNSTLRLTKTKVRYLTDDCAVVHAKTVLENQTPLNDEISPQKRKNILVFVVKKEGEEWICHTAQNTEIIPNMETWVRDEEGGIRAVNYGEFGKDA